MKNMGKMVEDADSNIRSNVDSMYLGKVRTVTGYLRCVPQHHHCTLLSTNTACVGNFTLTSRALALPLLSRSGGKNAGKRTHSALGKDLAAFMKANVRK